MRLLSVLILLPFLAACATLTEEQCRTGDWTNIGYNDGLKGRSENYVSNHFDACAELGITPNVAAWESGREQGLLRYCTPENAYIIGRNGDNFNQVCKPSEQASLNSAFDWGMEHYVISQEIFILTEEKTEIEILIASSLSHPDLTPEEAAQLAQLEARIRLIELQILRLQSRLERYAVLPY